MKVNFKSINLDLALCAGYIFMLLFTICIGYAKMRRIYIEVT